MPEDVGTDGAVADVLVLGAETSTGTGASGLDEPFAGERGPGLLAPSLVDQDDGEHAVLIQEETPEAAGHAARHRGELVSNRVHRPRRADLTRLDDRKPAFR